MSSDTAASVSRCSAGGIQAALLVAEFTYTPNSDRIAAAVLKHRLPTMYDFRQLPAAGGLVSYGVNLPDHFRRAAYYVDRILHNGNPADMPVEQPTVFDMVINLRTAAALGVSVPATIMAFATEIIE